MDDNAYGHPSVVRDYVSRNGLFTAELAAIGEAWQSIRGDILDIGVGAGRTTAYLKDIGRSYRALDIAPAMVEACRKLHPDADVRVGDARSLDGIGDGSCDFVIFSFNGIDYVEIDERPAVLAAVMRVLRPGGTFVYSSHNLSVLQGAYPPLTMPSLSWTANPLRLGIRAARLLATRRRRSGNRERLGPLQSINHRHAVVNDEDHDFSHLTTYVDPRHELEALVEAGFVDTLAIDAAGRRVGWDISDPWVHYVARKPG